MEKSVDESVVKLTAGILHALQLVVVALESSGSIDRQALEYLIDQRLQAMSQSDLEAAPLAMMLQWLRPQDPPSPVLRLVKS
ncbi:MAG TPA: hypothetical protein PLO14_03210 [Accumulibacter sp.]|uniref:hypothetical protein n=1 Tax=Accumulibacter sp. TaxID=2053492 RepID=UPI0025F8B1F0|nr:hypothetical protein [Accumulibacter sp.]MCM8599923.1 hypothetical protein [Accumulibacter sp.]MCM8664107.1 hypothetical protein [Accumulibacter sp.]HNC51237.1 hypothetical protein [Accumulibacter sp.]